MRGWRKKTVHWKNEKKPGKEEGKIKAIKRGRTNRWKENRMTVRRN